MSAHSDAAADLQSAEFAAVEALLDEIAMASEEHRPTPAGGAGGGGQDPDSGEEEEGEEGADETGAGSGPASGDVRQWSLYSQACELRLQEARTHMPAFTSELEQLLAAHKDAHAADRDAQVDRLRTADATLVQKACGMAYAKEARSAPYGTVATLMRGGGVLAKLDNRWGALEIYPST